MFSNVEQRSVLDNQYTIYIILFYSVKLTLKPFSVSAKTVCALFEVCFPLDNDCVSKLYQFIAYRDFKGVIACVELLSAVVITSFSEYIFNVLPRFLSGVNNDGKCCQDVFIVHCSHLTFLRCMSEASYRTGQVFLPNRRRFS